MWVIGSPKVSCKMGVVPKGAVRMSVLGLWSELKVTPLPHAVESTAGYSETRDKKIKEAKSHARDLQT